MLVRKIEKNIADWIKNGEKTLLVQGGRQVGKTYTIRKCLKRSKFKYVEFNFIDDLRLSGIMDNSTGIDDLILKLSLLSGRKIIPGETIIFFDEIQRSNGILDKVKLFTEDNRYRFILSGSLLGIDVENIDASLISAFQVIKMYPLDFQEFIQVFHVSDDVIKLLKKSFMEKTPVDSFINERMMEIFNMYLIIGGMPRVVENYRNFGDIDQVIDGHKEIIRQNKIDFTGYNISGKKYSLAKIYDMVSYQLNRRTKRFKISDINVTLRYERVKDLFELLWKSGAIYPVFNVEIKGQSLSLKRKNTLFKLFYNDVGILSSIYGKDVKLSILSKEKNISFGAIHESAVAQELLAHGFKFFYYSDKADGELDFVIADGKKIIPVEVRVGKGYPRHSAILHFLNSDMKNLSAPIVFTGDNLHEDRGLTTYPIYMMMFLEKERLNFVDISVEKFSM